ncbi:MAG: hypothetical protein M3Q42_00925 [Pseudomonadota bacterium]|nr:hypothetical protein [Pseudomonadota bacterium]
MFALFALFALGVPFSRLSEAAWHTGGRNAARPPDRRALALAYAGLLAGGLVLIGLCALLFKIVTTAAPALLLFGLPLAGYGLAALAVVLVVLTALSVVLGEPGERAGCSGGPISGWP